MFDTILNQQWLIPSSVRNWFSNDWGRQGFKKYFLNTGWMFIARIATFITSFLTTAIIARYLGPENLGKLDYAQSYVAILSVLASLGIDQVLFRDLIANPEKENDLLGTAIISKVFFGSLAFIIAVGSSFFIAQDSILTVLVAIIAFSFIIGPIGTVGIFFNAQVKAKFGSQITIFLAFFLTLLKLLIVFSGKGIIFFAIVLLLESLISAGWSMYIYVHRFHKRPNQWRFHLDIFKQLMKDSWPLLVAGFSGYIYAKIDQVLILHYFDSAAVGIYGAAVKLTQIWAFLPGLLIGSLFPAIVNAKKTSLSLYAKRFKLLSAVSVSSMIVIAIPLFIFAPFVIDLVFGDSFSASSSILRIYLWVSIAITLVVLAQQYLITENLSKIFLYSGLIGASSNVLLNIILIPAFGLSGSAWGTMISYLMVVISLLFFKQSRLGLYKIFGKHPNTQPTA